MGIMNLVYFDNITGTDFLAGESNPVAHLSTPPTPGDRISFGLSRLWTVLAVDHYTCDGQSLYLAHCNLTPMRREDWWSVAECQESTCYSLQLHLGNGELVHTGHHRRGAAPQVGFLLPRFNVKDHTVTSKPWGVEAVHAFHLADEIAYPVYRVIHVTDCVYVPEVAEAEKELAIAS
jgi:hypothetical protein